MKIIYLFFTLFLLAFYSLASGQPISTTERKYYDRTSFYSFVGVSKFRGIPVSVFIAGQAEIGGIINTQIAWAFREKISVVPSKYVAWTEWRVDFDCKAGQMIYLSFEDGDEHARVMRRGSGALWSPDPSESTPSVLGEELFKRVCGRAIRPTVVALGEAGRQPENILLPERTVRPRIVEQPPKITLAEPPRPINIQRENPKSEDKGPKGSSSGTGFFINNSGVLITNYHVIKGCSHISVADTNGALTEAISIASDRDLDLAAIQINQKSEGIPVHSDMPEIGEAILVFGYPLSNLLSTGGTATTGIISALTGVRDDKTKIQISAPIQPGNSGGSVVDYSGAVVGVVVSKLDSIRIANIIGDLPQNVNFAVSLQSLKIFLKNNGIKAVKNVAPQVMGTTSLVSKVRSQTRKVLCEY